MAKHSVHCFISVIALMLVLLLLSSATSPLNDISVSDGWQGGAFSHRVKIEESWQIREIEVTEPNPEYEVYRFFWRYLGGDAWALYQSLCDDPDMALLIATDIEYNWTPYYDRGDIICYSFYVYPDACYAVLHTGGAASGDEHLYRFSRSNGAVKLATGRMGLQVAVSGDYIYFTEDYSNGPNTTYRVHLPSVMAGASAEPQRIGQEGFYYGYVFSAFEGVARSGRPIGFCVENEFLYANGFTITSDFVSDKDMAFYRVDLRTMQHKKILERVIYHPRICGEWICFKPYLTLYRMRFDGRDVEMILDKVEDYYLDGRDILYREWRGQAPLQWLRYTMPD